MAYAFVHAEEDVGVGAVQELLFIPPAPDSALLQGVVHPSGKRFVHFAGSELYAVLPEEHPAASSGRVRLRDFASDEWILFPRGVNAVIYDTIAETARKEGIPTRQAHEIITAQQAFHLVSEHAGAAILPKPSALGLRAEGVVALPLADSSLSFQTCLIIVLR